MEEISVLPILVTNVLSTVRKGYACVDKTYFYCLFNFKDEIVSVDLVAHVDKHTLDNTRCRRRN
jgi:hypothetical protein